MSIRILHIKSNAQQIESWIALNEQDETIGHIFMKIENDNKIKFLDAWVDSNYRRIGVFRSLWETRWNYVNENYKNWTVYAWCKENSLPLLIEKGFDVGEIATYVEKKI